MNGLSATGQEMSQESPVLNVCVLSFAGGVGRTLLSACLTDAFSARGYRTALVDINRLHYTPYHMGLPNLVEGYARTRWGDIYTLKPSRHFSDAAGKVSGYRVAVYDFPLGIPEGWDVLLERSVKLVVVNHDIRTLRVTREQLDLYKIREYALVANRVPGTNLGSYARVVEDILGAAPAVVIPFDESVEAFVTDYAPASTRSGALNGVIRELAERLEMLNGQKTKEADRCA